MPTVAPSGGGIHAAVEVRNGGTIVKAGNVSADSPVTRNLALVELADDQGDSFGSRVVAKDGNLGSTTDSVGISGAVAGGVVDGTTVLGYNAGATEWVVRGGNVTTTLGGASNDILVSAGRDWDGQGATRPFIYSTSGDYLNGSMADRAFDVYAKPSTEIVPGRTKGTGAGDKLRFVQVDDGTSWADDDAATPSRAVPGELTYHFGGIAEPFTDEYKASDSAET